MRFPLRLETDAEQQGDHYVTTQASVYDADNRLIIEEPGPEATWWDLERLVFFANLGARVEGEK